jgi:hypothetical protein
MTRAWSGAFLKNYNKYFGANVWLENLMERESLEVPDVDGRIILKWILKK